MLSAQVEAKLWGSSNNQHNKKTPLSLSFFWGRAGANPVPPPLLVEEPLLRVQSWWYKAKSQNERN